MKKTLGAILTAAALVLPAAAAQADKKMTLDQVPTKAQETIKNHVKDGQILEIERPKWKSSVARASIPAKRKC